MFVQRVERLGLSLHNDVHLLSVPGSGFLLLTEVHRAGPVLCHPGRMLREMRNQTGGPNWVVRGLAILLALLLAGPLSVYLLQGLAGLVRTAF